jgi:hypothetical protein
MVKTPLLNMHSATATVFLLFCSGLNWATAFLPSSINLLYNQGKGCECLKICNGLNVKSSSSKLSIFRAIHSQRSEVHLNTKMTHQTSDGRKVVIVGSGPAGITVAHYLLQRNEGYDITIIDGRPDPRVGSEASTRSYSLGLGVRGRTALKKLPPYVWQGVRERGVECDR